MVSLPQHSEGGGCTISAWGLGTHRSPMPPPFSSLLSPVKGAMKGPAGAAETPNGLSPLQPAPSLEGRTRLVRILIGSPERPRQHSALSTPTGDRISAPKVHLHRERVEGVPEGSMGVNEVE